MDSSKDTLRPYQTVEVVSGDHKEHMRAGLAICRSSDQVSIHGANERRTDVWSNFLGYTVIPWESKTIKRMVFRRPERELPMFEITMFELSAFNHQV